ncbi:DivIVA domain-containing protein [Actinocorallia sp. API 0066]|uniref:DivIVA domain-containing protein n=1 Tax=Actinocorallia sp. API 0066 TaxID=2896846 RepID=UPI0035AC1D4F
MSDTDKIWTAISELGRKIDGLAEAVAEAAEPKKARHRGLPHRLTADDVRNVTFITTRVAPGYHTPEVDDFLDKVEAELDERSREHLALQAENERLAAENGDLRARLGGRVGEH